jgi:class 3 adenylate cyclase/tetratricopeptide (TPR) repeat protein
MQVCLNCGATDDAEAARYCRICSMPLRGPPESKDRRFVTIVRCDVVGSTKLGDRLDPEPFERVMARYVDTARAAFTWHGGMLERLVGDAVVGVFGLPVVHEDDALRAVRAAIEFRARLARLNEDLDRDSGVRLQVRTGVDTGEIVAGPGDLGQLTAAGDVMNVVTRLEEAAGPGEILLGEATLRLVREAVDVEDVGPLAVKGKASPVAAYRLLVLFPGLTRRPRRLEVAMVGRREEQALLKAGYEQAISKRACHLVTVYGAAGVGKSRLIDEFVATIDQHATVVRGHCLAYGGVAYDAIVQVISQTGRIDLADPDGARGRLGALVADDQHAGRITERVEQVLGLRKGTGPREDTYWALRRLLEILARRRPLVVVLDDLHWAESDLLDLVQELAESSREAPLVLVCAARFELLEKRRYWGGGKLNAITVQLGPLVADEVKQLVTHLLGGVSAAPRIHDYVVERSEGNPLFVEGLVVMLREEGLLRLGDGQWLAAEDLATVKVPPSIQALLRARLEYLGPEERAVIERAAVIGRRFTVGAVVALTPDADRRGVEASLRALVHKELIVPETGAAEVTAGREEGYSFHHVLFQEATYEGIRKEVAAALHERYADWLEQVPRNGVAEVGYHLERAYRQLVAVRPNDVRAPRLARRAGEALATTGHRAAMRGDVPTTAVTLLRRAVSLLTENDDLRRAALLDLADALSGARQPTRAMEVYDQVIDASMKKDDRSRMTHGKLGRLGVRWFNGRTGIGSEGGAEIEAAIGVFSELGDDLGLARAWRLLAYVHWGLGYLKKAREASRQAIELARSSGDEQLEAKSVSSHCFILFWGPAHLDEVIRYSEQALEWARSRGTRSLQADALRILARAAAMQGRFGDARRLLVEASKSPAPADDLFDEAGAAVVRPSDLLVWVGDYLSGGLVELLADDPATAELTLRRGYEALKKVDGKGLLPPLTILLARALTMQGRDDEAERMTRECEELAPPSQLDSQIKWRAIRAVVLARRGEQDEAERLAREAADLTRDSEQIDSTAEVLVDLGSVLRHAGRSEEMASCAQQAVVLYEQKGNLVGVRRVERLLGPAR